MNKEISVVISDRAHFSKCRKKEETFWLTVGAYLLQQLQLSFFAYSSFGCSDEHVPTGENFNCDNCKSISSSCKEKLQL